MSDSSILSYEQLVQINLTLQKENDLLKQQNIELRNSLTELKEYYQSDELWETRITRLQNKVKDQHIQLESQYKRETKLQQQIKELETLAKDQQTIINYAAGYISACEQFRDKHPTDVVKWLFKGLE